MPRTLVQAAGFVLGFWLALCVWPLQIELARAQGAPAGDASLPALEVALHREVNAVRAGRHLIPLRRVEALDAVARAHSADMARRGYLSHTTPEGAGPVERLRAAGLEGFSLAAENAGRTDEPEAVRAIVEGWLASEAHRRNLHAPPFNATGIGVARAPDGALLVTQVYVTYPR